MGTDDVKNYMGYMWMHQEDGIVTIGINEDGLEDFESINSIELPSEHEEVGAESIIATIETSDGPLDIYSPVDGTIIEVNSQVIEDPSIIMEDPYEEGWLVRIEVDEDYEEDEDFDYDDEDEDEDDEDDEDEDDYEEEEEED